MRFNLKEILSSSQLILNCGRAPRNYEVLDFPRKQPASTEKKCESLSVHDHSNELFVVHVPLGVFLVVHQLLDLLVAELLTERGQQVAEFGGRDEAAGILVEMTKPFDEVVGSVAGALL